jgi:hypothetical protein
MVKGFLSLRQVEFIEKNVATDLDGRAELLDMGFDSTPVTVIGDKRLYGFDVQKIDEALALLDSK